MKVNFQDPILFKCRFKRDPKFWSISDIHELWIRSEKRRMNQLSDLLKHREIIFNEIPKKVVYFKSNNKSNSIKWTFDPMISEYWVAMDEVKFPETTQGKREGALFKILPRDREYELGEEYIRLSRKISNIGYRVKHIMTELIFNQVREKYKGKRTPKVINIQIGESKYYITSDQDMYYPKFEFCVQNDDIIKF